ncbi:hypothetical protein CLU79DRAFT_690798, partial [Phycomyces nitens]
QAPQKWRLFVNQQFLDCVTPPDSPLMPTFHSNTSSSYIDYIYASKNIASHRMSGNVTYIHQQWTDYYLVRTSLHFPSSNSTGEGLWRANPLLARSESYRSSLYFLLS